MNLSIADKLLLQQFFAKQPVKTAYLFGSYAPNEASSKIDIDILVVLDFSKHIDLDLCKCSQTLKNYCIKK